MAVSGKAKLFFLVLLALILTSESLCDTQSSEKIQWGPIQSNFYPLESELEGDLKAGSLTSDEPPYDEDDWSKQIAMGWHGYWPARRPSNQRRWKVEEERILKEMDERKQREAMEQLQKDKELKKARATKELAWFVITAVLPLLVIFMFKLHSAAISRKAKIHHDKPCNNHSSCEAKSL